jgi:putative transposase
MVRFFHPLLKLIASATHQELLAQVQYLKAENEILRSRLPRRVIVTRAERARLVRLGILVGAVIGQLVTIVKPRTLARWVRQYNGTPSKKRTGRPRIEEDIEALVVRLAKETGWGYTRILGELRKLGIRRVSRSTVVNILRRNGLETGPRCGEGSWLQFIQIHAETLWACDFITKKIWTQRGLIDYFILFAINVQSRRVHVLGMTANPTSEWMAQQARNLCMHWQDQEQPASDLIRDRDGKFTAQFDAIVTSEGVQVVRLTPGTPNLNAYAERWVQSLKYECLNNFIVLGERHLRHLVSQYVEHYLNERPHQAKDNMPLSGASPPTEPHGDIICHERLGGLLRHYTRQAA